MQNDTDTSNPKVTIEYWVEMYSDTMYAWAFHKTSSKEAAEDLVQETFLAAIHSFTKFKGDSNPKTWLFGILNNKISDHYRRAYRLPTIGSDSIFDNLFDENGQWKAEERPQPWNDESGHLLDNADFNNILHQCMKNLPEQWYAAIQLKFMEERKGEHICQELGITDTNFWQILHRSKLQLRKCLDINWFKK